MIDRKPTLLEDGWNYMGKGITKLKNILEGVPESQFTSEEYMMLYTTIYNMCTQNPPHDYSQQLYDKYREAIEEYLWSTVLPSLKEKHGEYLLRGLVRRRGDHKIMVRWLSHFFHYLDRYFISRRSLPALKEVGLTSFRELVYNDVLVRTRDAIIVLIEEREGAQIDRALLKNVVDIFVEVGSNDLKVQMLNDSAIYYSRKASKWIQRDSFPEHMIKAEECLKKERSQYLHFIIWQKLVEKVHNELLVVNATELLAENSRLY